MTRPPPSAAARVETLLVLAYATWLVLPGRTVDARLWVSDVAFVVAPAWAAHAAWRAGRADGPWRLTWRRTSLACAAWAVGSVIWGFEQLVLGISEPFPSWADVGYLAYPLLAVAGLVAVPALPRSGAPRIRLVLDGAVVAGSLLLLTGLGVLLNLVRAQDLGLAAKVLSVAFPVADVVAGSVVLVLLPRLRHSRGPGMSLALALALVVSADTVYAALASADAYTPGGPLDLVYAVAFAVVARAARRPAPSGPLPAPAVTELSAMRALLPLVPVGLAAVGVALTGVWRDTHAPLVVALASALGTLIFLRQFLLVVENVALARDLESMVTVRTAELHEARELYRHRAYHDALTELPNRAALTEALDAAVADGSRVGLLLLDLDGFKEVNDTHGHAVGDALLCEVADLLRQAVGPSALLARLGGDEFAVLLTDAGPREAEVLAERLLDALRAPVLLAGTEVVVAGSIGHTTATGQDPTALLRDADVAMYAAKEEGKGRAVRWTAALHDARADRTRLVVELRDGIARGELEVHYQPVVELTTGRVCGVEALVRWRHPVEGLLLPGRFLEVAEESGLVVDLGRVVVAQAVADVAAWRRATGRDDLWVSVNLSARHLVDPSLDDDLLEPLLEHGLAPDALVVEVTETLLVEGAGAAAQALHRLRAAGFWLALDDFGTGWSSLSRLHELPFNTVKIDRSFVAGVRASDDPAPVLSAAVAMGQGLGLTVVAEGVETSDQVAFLLASGCERAQGYLFRRPVPAGEVTALLLPGGLGSSVPAPRTATDGLSAPRRG